MKLTQHFDLSEFTDSYTAQAHGIDNSVPDIDIAHNLLLLCTKVLEPLREYLGHPIRISSGYRCQMLNAVVHGAKNSQHMTGQACDIACARRDEAELIFDYIRKNLDYDQLIFETKTGQRQDIVWVHVSYVHNRNRRIAMRSVDGHVSSASQLVASSDGKR